MQSPKISSLDYPGFSFDITFQSQSSRARLGVLNTPHGSVETPAFIFCATKAAIKGLSPHQMKACGTQFILSNTYHLMLSPGSKLIQKMGGIHKFMGWDGPILTDSGGFQVFSLGHGSVASEIKGKRFGGRRKTLLEITEEGAEFKSYLDGKKHMLSPEKSIETQRELGTDFVVVFDECTPFHVDKSYTELSMHRSHRWEERSLTEFSKHHNGTQALYGIVQGGIYEDLRREATDFVNSQPFFAHAVGGSLGADKEQMYDVVSYTMSLLTPERPVHLLGIGGVRDIFEGVQQGIDTFDCVHPTRLARHGGALIRADQDIETDKEHINLKNASFREDPEPIDASCECETCQTYSRSYLHYLLKAKELLAMQAITIHNVFYMNRLLQAVRGAIKSDTLLEERKKWVKG